MSPDKELRHVLSKGGVEYAIQYYTGKLVGLSYAYNQTVYLLIASKK